MIFYSCVFSLESAAKNEYIYMLMLLYNSLKKTQSLVRGDKYYLMADPETAEVVRGVPCLSEIIILPMPKPATMLEGMSWRYQLHRQTDVMFQSICYLDVDMLCIKKFQLAIQDTDVLCVYPEGIASDTNYCGSKPLKGEIGVSSTMFAYCLGEKTLQLLERILFNIRTDPQENYTLDQPYLNHAIQDVSPVGLLPNSIISFNGHNNLPEAYFINCCGCPGDGAFHFRKMLEISMRV